MLPKELKEAKDKVVRSVKRDEYVADTLWKDQPRKSFNKAESKARRK